MLFFHQFLNVQTYTKVRRLVLSQRGVGTCISQIWVNWHGFMFQTVVLLNQITSLSFLAIQVTSISRFVISAILRYSFLIFIRASALRVPYSNQSFRTRSLSRSISSLCLAQSCSYFAHRVPLGNGCAMTFLGQS